MERVEKRNSSVAPSFKNILPNYKIQQWPQFLKKGGKKLSIRFLADEWKKEFSRIMLKGTTSVELPNVAIYQKRGTEARSRFVEMEGVSDGIGPMAARCLPGMHAFTGSDSVIVFGGKGKLKAYKLVYSTE